MPSALLQLSATEGFSNYAILVDKKKRTLHIFERDGNLIKPTQEFPTDIGKEVGNKSKENDYRTPEGIYFFQQIKRPPEIPFALYGKMAFTTDYPNLFDRRQKKSGSGIWLHAIPDSTPLTRGSRGCVVVRNHNLDKIEKIIQLRQTPLIILDEIEFLTEAEHAARKNTVVDWVNNWKKAWQSQDTAAYLKFYTDDFSAPGFKSLKSWSKHKTRLAKNYQKIAVELETPSILRDNSELIIRMLQKYTSDKHTDYGVKTLFVVEKDKEFKILREEWTPSNPKGDLAAQSAAAGPTAETQ